MEFIGCDSALGYKTFEKKKEKSHFITNASSHFEARTGWIVAWNWLLIAEYLLFIDRYRKEQ